MVGKHTILLCLILFSTLLHQQSSQISRAKGHLFHCDETITIHSGCNTKDQAANSIYLAIMIQRSSLHTHSNSVPTHGYLGIRTQTHMRCKTGFFYTQGSCRNQSWYTRWPCWFQAKSPTGCLWNAISFCRFLWSINNCPHSQYWLTSPFGRQEVVVPPPMSCDIALSE